MVSSEQASWFAKAAIVLFTAEAAMQLWIAAGIAPVSIVWGGGQNELTPFLRIASVFAATVLLGFAWVIHQRSLPLHASWINVASWFVSGYMMLNTLGNLASVSPFERYVSGSVTMILAVCCSVVSSSTTPINSEYERIQVDDSIQLVE